MFRIPPKPNTTSVLIVETPVEPEVVQDYTVAVEVEEILAEEDNREIQVPARRRHMVP